MNRTSVFIKRDDLIHPFVSGNKWRKLKHHIQTMHREGLSSIVTCGGPWSNHILATASVCHDLGFRSTGLIRGDYYPEINPLLKRAKILGMDIRFLSNEVFDKLQFKPFDILQQLKLNEQKFIPVGGAGPSGVKGCHDIVAELLATGVRPNRIVLAAGTGTTAQGVLAAIDWPCHLFVFPAISSEKEVEILHSNLDQIRTSNGYTILPTHECPFGKVNQALLDFIRDFHLQTGILLDPMYTGKMVDVYIQYLISDQISGHRPPTDQTVIYHSGGLAGWHGVMHRYSRSLNLSFLQSIEGWETF